MEVENAAGFFHAFGIFVGAVAGGVEIEFGNRSIEVGTPIGDHSVRGAGRVPFAAVAGNGVIGNAGGDGEFVDRQDEGIVR